MGLTLFDFHLLSENILQYNLYHTSHIMINLGGISYAAYVMLVITFPL